MTADDPAYIDWLTVEIREAVDDPGPNLSHDDVMAAMEADIAALSGR